MRPLARKTTLWRNRGIVMTRRMLSAKANGEGLNRDSAHVMEEDELDILEIPLGGCSSLSLVWRRGFVDAKNGANDDP